MSEIEHWLLLALAALVARQRALAFGEPDPGALAAWLRPELFSFAHERGAHRCRIERARLTRFQGAVLSLERQDFVSPVSALRPHLKLLEAADGAYEAKLLPPFVDALGLADDDPVRAVYSPLQLLFGAHCGFFDPRRESWHAYAGRALAAQLPQAQALAEPSRSRVTWPGGTLELADAPAGLQLAARTPALDFELAVEAEAFELRLRAADPTRGLIADLLRLRGAAELPVGIDVDGGNDAGARGLTIRGSL